MRKVLVFCLVLFGYTNLYSQVDNSAPFIMEIAKFPGDINKYIADNLIYPKDAKKNHIEGTVYVSFVVEMNGSVDSIKVLRGVKEAPSMDNEAVRLIKKMPKWSWLPGTKSGSPHNKRYMLPIRFNLDVNSSTQKRY